MKPRSGFLSNLIRRPRSTTIRRPGFLSRFLSDEHGSYIVLMTLAMPVLVGIGGLATEGGYWLYNHRVVQSAADNAAYSAATAYAIDSTVNLTSQAKAAAASSYGLVDGKNGVTVTLNKPPTGLCGTSSYIGNTNAIEVAVQTSVSRSFSGMWLSGNVNICGRAVALVRGGGDCLLALATTGTGITVSGNNTTISLSRCSLFSNSVAANAISISGNSNTTITADSVGAVGGITGQSNIVQPPTNVTTGDPPLTDPYASAASSWPQTGGATQPCAPNSCTTTLSPGIYSGGLNLAQNNTYTMNAGIYYLTGNLNFSGNNITLNGTNVTIVLLGSSSVITGNKNNETLNITAPSSGWNAGLAIWAPTSTGTMNLGFKNNAVVGVIGLIYTPHADVNFGKNNGTTTCTQIVAKTITFNGNNQSFKGDCFGTTGNPKKFGELIALVE
jgi:Flp pilus assembly protein TadG